MIPTFVTLEPNDYNKDATALTIYVHWTTPPEEVEKWLLNADPSHYSNLPLWVDVSDPFFKVVRTSVQPFNNSVRYQAHPTA